MQLFKVLYPIIAIFGIASCAFATVADQKGIQSRELQGGQVGSTLVAAKNLQSSVAPVLDQLNKAASTGVDPSDLLSELESILQEVTSLLGGIVGPTATSTTHAPTTTAHTSIPSPLPTTPASTDDIITIVITILQSIISTLTQVL